MILFLTKKRLDYILNKLGQLEIKVDMLEQIEKLSEEAADELLEEQMQQEVNERLSKK
tara:strand:- start:1237 stop:1410 length:174 start_codon:yes stop_codon:yes gene_type:complete